MQLAFLFLLPFEFESVPKPKMLVSSSFLKPMSLWLLHQPPHQLQLVWYLIELM
ncbi:hypothetical protein Scep_019185 [Stephania cephalantha]|uniref:Uncharacterized protein n=1 Tax=Stephania cephalantha TaxID=152367 RepID=A0AAP0IA87_9MAGN